MVDNIELFHWDGTLNLQPVIQPLGIVIISASAAVFGSVWLVKKLYSTRSFDHIALRQEMKADEGFTGVVTGLGSLVGEQVTVFTDMRPGGKVKTVDGHILEASLKFGGFASKGEKLRVLSAEQGRLYCEKL
jgi:membrane-bound ClpP family serine protease